MTLASWPGAAAAQRGQLKNARAGKTHDLFKWIEDKGLAHSRFSVT